MKLSYLKKITKLLLFATLVAVNLLNLNIEATAAPAMQFSEEELKALGLTQDDTAQLQELFETLQNLPPEDLKFLEEVGQQLENDMRSQGLDPSKPEDVFKWVEKQSPQTTQIPKKESSEKSKTSNIEPKKAELVQVVLPTSASALLEETNSAITRLRQKAYIAPKMYRKIDKWRPELNELQYYLNILTQQALLKHLTSKDFEQLYQKIERLYRILSQYEPLIIVKETEKEGTNNPYALLGVPYKATTEQIQEAFDKLSQEYNLDQLAESLKKAGITGKVYKRRLKEASLLFAYIKDAYEILSDPKLRSILDRTLKEEIEQDSALEEVSIDAFNNLFDKLTKLLSTDNLLKDIQKLIEKYKPEELALAKSQEELEKIVMQRSQQRPKISSSSSAFQYQPYKTAGEYDAFYRDLERSIHQRTVSRAQQARQNQFKSSENRPMGAEKPESALGGAKQPEKAKPAPGKEAEKKKAGDKDKEKEKKKQEEGTKAKPGAKAGRENKAEAGKKAKETEKKAEKKTASKEETQELYALIDKISQKLKIVKSFIEPEPAEPDEELSEEALEEFTRIYRSSRIEPEGDQEDQEGLEPKLEHTVPLSKLMSEVNKQLDGSQVLPTRSRRLAGSGLETAVAESPIQELAKLFKTADFYSIANMLYKFNKTISQKEYPAEDLAKKWENEIAKPYSDLIEKVYEDIYPVLDPVMRRNKNHHIAQQYNSNYLNWRELSQPPLTESEKKLYRENKEQREKIMRTRAHPDINESTTPPLGWYAKDIKDLCDYFIKATKTIAENAKEAAKAKKEKSKK